jgi:hypothetical protein
VKIPAKLAAYRLGYLPYSFKIGMRVFSEMPYWELADSVLQNPEQIREAAVVLAAEIPTNVYQEICHWLEPHLHRWEAIAVMMYRSVTEGIPVDFESLPVLPSFPCDLEHLTDLAIPATSSNRPLYTLGAAMGAFHWQADSLPLGGVRCMDHPVYGAIQWVENPVVTLPDLLPVVDAARGLSTTDLQEIPAAREIVRHGRKLSELGPRSFLKKIVLACGKKTGDEFRSSPLQDVPLICEFIDTLSATIESALELATNPGEAKFSHEALAGIQKPRWCKEDRKLRVGEITVKEVRSIAFNVIQVLDEFEKQDWRQSIIYPVKCESENQSQRMHDTIESLNYHLILMRFHGDGMSIAWERSW